MAKTKFILEITNEYSRAEVDGPVIDIMPRLVQIFQVQPKIKEIFKTALQVEEHLEAQKNKPSQN